MLQQQPCSLELCSLLGKQINKFLPRKVGFVPQLIHLYMPYWEGQLCGFEDHNVTGLGSHHDGRCDTHAAIHCVKMTVDTQGGKKGRLPFVSLTWSMSENESSLRELWSINSEWLRVRNWIIKLEWASRPVMLQSIRNSKNTATALMHEMLELYETFTLPSIHTRYRNLAHLIYCIKCGTLPVPE